MAKLAADEGTRDHQATSSTIDVTHRLNEMFDGGPINVEEKKLLGGIRQVGARRQAGATTCIFGVLSTLTNHSRYSKAVAEDDVVAFFLPGSNFVKLMQRFRQHRTVVDNAERGSVSRKTKTKKNARPRPKAKAVEMAPRQRRVQSSIPSATPTALSRPQ